MQTVARGLARRAGAAGAVAAVAAVAILAGAAASARAEPIKKCTVSTTGATSCKTVCRQTLPNGNTVDYDEGTTITVNYTDGTSQKYTCKNGEWVKTRFVLGTVLNSVVVLGVQDFANGYTVSCPPTDIRCAVLVSRPPLALGG